MDLVAVSNLQSFTFRNVKPALLHVEKTTALWLHWLHCTHAFASVGAQNPATCALLFSRKLKIYNELVLVVARRMLPPALLPREQTIIANVNIERHCVVSVPKASRFSSGRVFFARQRRTAYDINKMNIIVYILSGWGSKLFVERKLCFYNIFIVDSTETRECLSFEFSFSPDFNLILTHRLTKFCWILFHSTDIVVDSLVVLRKETRSFVYFANTEAETKLIYYFKWNRSTCNQ